MTIKSAAVIFMALLFWMTTGSVKVFGQSHPASVKIIRGDDGQKVMYGKATHYSKSLEGSKTAIGTRYSNSKLTAASNHFKLRSWVRVTRITNGKSVIVYVNDRMHRSMIHKGRIIDLSVAAAEQLDFMGPAGITRVKVEEIPESEAVSLNANFNGSE